MPSTEAEAEAGAEADDGYERVFNMEAFSDRVLRIEVVGRDDDEAVSGSSGGAAGGSCADRKRRREEDKGDDGEGIDSSCIVLATPVLRVKTIYVSSAVLAAKSNFFFKLFSNGMKESGQRQSTVRITYSEENAFMELLRFMYSGKLTPTSDPTLLVDILMAADKFEVVSCMKFCGQRLIAMPMTLESAVTCLALPSSISMAADLSEAAKKFLVARYKEVRSTKFQDELMRIPLSGIVAILSRSDLRAVSEEALYEFVLRLQQSSSFGLLLEVLEDKGPVKGRIEYKFEAKTRHSLQYVTWYECTSTDSREAVECKDLFGVPWSEFIAHDSLFFIDNELHLQVHLKIM